MDGVNKVGLHHGVVSVLHGIGSVDHINLEKISQLILGRWKQWLSLCVCDETAPSYLDLEAVADVATVELGADQLEFPVKESLGVPVLVADQVQDLLVVGHGVHAWNTRNLNDLQKPFYQITTNES